MANSVSAQNQIQQYVVISPVKNEAKFLEDTLNSMVNQNVLPAEWILVNDGSTDGSEVIIQQYTEIYRWIRLVNRSDGGGRKRGKGVIEAFYEGYRALTVAYDYIVKLDGDVSFEPGYFEGLLNEFCADPKLGIAGGAVYEAPDGKTWKLYTNREHVRGATKMYRRACFDAIGGLSASMGWDGIDEWKALSLGWKVCSFLHLTMYHYRFTGAATGFVKSFYEQGYGAYRMGYHPLYILARSLRRMADRPYGVGGVAMILAYFWSWLQQEERLADPGVVKYIRQEQLNSLTRMIGKRPSIKH